MKENALKTDLKLNCVRLDDVFFVNYNNFSFTIVRNSPYKVFG